MWHSLICENFIGTEYKLNWKGNHTRISFTAQNQYDVYDQLNQAAQVLYENRITLREVKDKALQDLSENYLKKADAQKIEMHFTEKASALLKELKASIQAQRSRNDNSAP